MTCVIDWAALPARDGEGSNLSILLRTERLLLGETPLKVDETAINLKPNEFDVSFDGSDMAGWGLRLGEGPFLIGLGHLVLPGGGGLLDPRAW